MNAMRWAAAGWIGLGGLLSAFPTAAGHAAPAPEIRKESAFACNTLALDEEARKRHFDELGPAIRTKIRGVRELSDGYELELPGDAETYRMVNEWAVGERACCPFFDIAVTAEREGGPLHLRLTGREGVKRFIEIDGAAWIRR